MKKSNIFGLSLLILILGLLPLSAAAQNLLRVADFTAAADKEAVVPIYLDNSSDVVGMQFNINLPYKRSNSNVTLVDERTDGHSISLRRLSDTRYTVVVMSLQNRPLRGNGGLMIRFPIQIAADAQADDRKEVTLTDIVLSGRDGRNVASETTSTATFTVLRTPTPDFVVTDLKIAGTDETLVPGGQMRLEFYVENQGSGASTDGWSEKIYLEDLTGQRTYVTAQRYGNTLPAGDKMWRSYEVTLPKDLHMEGTVMAVVEVTALNSTDELIADQGNNSGISGNTRQLEKRLFLSVDRLLLKEGDYSRVTLTRSGDWTMDETYELAETNDHGVMMLTLPASVTIPAKKAAVNFYVTATNNTTVNEQYRTGLKVSGDGYPDATMIVDVEDDDSYPLTLTTDKNSYTEGDEVTLTVGIETALANDLKVDIAKTNASRFNPYVRSITIPAGETSASATTSVVNDAYPMADEIVTITATATGYVTAKRTIGIQDDDWPVLSMQFSRTIISEGDGYGATMATVTRTGNTAENLTLYLNYTAKSVPSGANSSELFFDSQYVIIPAGQPSVTFPVSVKDNSNLEGQRQWTVNAAACDANTGRPVSAGHVSTRWGVLTVTDDDTEGVLKLQCGTATLPEAGQKATVTITRNGNQGDLTVSLTAEGAELEMPGTVTISNGNTSATFQVAAKATVSEENYYVRVSASADGCQPSQFVFMVSTKPDAVCTMAELSEDQLYGGQTVNVTINVTNQGTSTLKSGMDVYFYLMNMQSYSPGSSAFTSSDLYQGTLPTDVPAGETVPMTFSIELPLYYKAQQYYMMAWLNPRQTSTESNTSNNRSSNTLPLYIHPACTLASISTERHNYTRGDVIHFTGRMSNAESGIPMEGKQVDVYMINDTKRYQTTATLDASGNFTAEYTFGEQTGGRYNVGACMHGIGSTETKATINVTRLQIERSSYLLKDVTEGIALEGDIQVTNLSEEPLQNITFRMTDLPEDWTVELTSIAELAGNATGNAHYRIVPSTPTQAKKLISGTFIASAKDSEGGQIADSEMPLYFWWYAAQCKLVAETVNTTLYRLGQRSVTMTIENVGLKETGSIGVEYSSGQNWLSVPTSQIASVSKDGKATLTLNLTGNENLIVDGKYEAMVRLKPANGDKLDVKVKCAVVSTDIGRLLVDVVDAYTQSADDGNGPHVSGASVRVTNALTGEVAITGTTGDDGLFCTDYENNKLKEGTYYVYVTASNHYHAEKTITVDPGVDNQLEVFLNYETVKISYTVERTTVQDEYKTVLTMDIVPDIPQAIVVPELPENWGVGQHAYSVRLTNKGRLTAYTPYLEFPNIDGYTFKVKSDYPTVIYPDESFDVTIEYTGPEDASTTSLGYIRMYYGFKLQGEMHWSNETYACAVGRGDVLLFVEGGGMPMAGSDSEGRNFGEYKPPTTSSDDAFGFVYDDLGDIGVIDPEIEIRDYTKSIDNRIRLQFEQKFILEREAFKGSLKVENQQDYDIEGVTIIPNVKTMAGEDATDLFSITTQGTGDWEGQDRWNLTGSGVGEAQVLYVPSKEAAPTKPVQYLFGGTVNYRNVSDGRLVTYELTPTQLTVNPSPDLHLTYFVQRDFVSDDPLTEEVEPWEPTQFALLIQNKGAGEALNLEIETSEPTIVDNACNLPVKFTKLYCTVDGVEKDMDFNYLNLGSIAPGQNIMARWWFYCNVSAHVANYEARMLKHSSFGEEFDLITLDGVRELTRSVKGSLANPATARNRKKALTEEQKTSDIMLLNLIPDEDNLPDHVMDLEGNETDELEIVSDKVTVIGTGDGQTVQYTLSVTATREGWVYGVVHDPTNCAMSLVKAVRNSDGKDVTANVWQTDRTVTSNYSTIVENRLHFADNIATSESYTLTYAPKPAAAPQVASIKLNVKEVAESKTTSAVVTFADVIDTSSLDAEDFVLSVGDRTYEVTVTPKSSTSCLVSWTDNILIPGDYTLTAFTSGIKNTEGTVGFTNKSQTWASVGNLPMGDVNGDGVVNIYDYIGVANCILGIPNTSFFMLVGDIDNDGEITIYDYIGVADIILYGSQNGNANARSKDAQKENPTIDPE